jgi:hypothetical protein
MEHAKNPVSLRNSSYVVDLVLLVGDVLKVMHCIDTYNLINTTTLKYPFAYSLHSLNGRLKEYGFKLIKP